MKGKNSKYIVDFLKDEFSDFYKKYSQKLHLFISSQFFLRVGSNLLSAIVVKLIKKDSCEIDIISGGGGEGIFGITLNSEIDRNKYIIKSIEGFCKEYKCKLIRDKR